MPLLVLIVAALLAGSLAAYAVRRAHLHLADAPRWPRPRRGDALGLRAAVVHHLSGGRLDAAEATGAALFAAFVVTVVGALVVGILTSWLRSSAGDLRLDSSVADWGQDEATAWSTDVIRAITHLGDTRTVAIAAIVVAARRVWRSRDRDRLWAPLFLVVVIVGNNALFNVLKELIDRARPAFDRAPRPSGRRFPAATRRPRPRATRRWRSCSPAAARSRGARAAPARRSASRSRSP